MVVDEEANKVEVDHVEEDLGGDKLLLLLTDLILLFILIFSK